MMRKTLVALMASLALVAIAAPALAAGNGTINPLEPVRINGGNGTINPLQPGAQVTSW